MELGPEIHTIWGFWDLIPYWQSKCPSRILSAENLRSSTQLLAWSSVLWLLVLRMRPNGTNHLKPPYVCTYILYTHIMPLRRHNYTHQTQTKPLPHVWALRLGAWHEACKAARASLSAMLAEASWPASAALSRRHSVISAYRRRYVS